MRIALSIILLLYIVSCSAMKTGEIPREPGQVEKALEDARRYAENGDYEKALERHIWFHDNALSIDPSYYGVRLSFALSDWVCLGEKYPKAMDALIRIRDQKESKLVSGEYNRERFQDVEAINLHLKDTDNTVKLFKNFDENNPEFAKSVYDIAIDSLCKAKQFSLARKYLGDPLERFERSKQNYRRGLDFAEKSRNCKASREAFGGIFSDEMVRLIVILENSGERDLAEKIRTLALEIFDSKDIKNAINGEKPHPL